MGGPCLRGDNPDTEEEAREAEAEPVAVWPQVGESWEDPGAGNEGGALEPSQGAWPLAP